MTKVSVMSLSSAETAETEKVWSPKPSCAGACGRETTTSVGVGGSGVALIGNVVGHSTPYRLSISMPRWFERLSYEDGSSQGQNLAVTAWCVLGSLEAPRPGRPRRPFFRAWGVGCCRERVEFRVYGFGFRV